MICASIFSFFSALARLIAVLIRCIYLFTIGFSTIVSEVTM